MTSKSSISASTILRWVRRWSRLSMGMAAPEITAHVYTQLLAAEVQALNVRQERIKRGFGGSPCCSARIGTQQPAVPAGWSRLGISAKL